jgi:MoaA/NifB/PqqE/SkfB family radical SAM enzyme
LTTALSWEFTNSCHLRCKTCLPASGLARAGELTTEQCLVMLDGLAAEGATRLLMTGGEPLFRRDFADVLSHAAGLGLATAVITSGTLGSKRALAAIRAAGARLSVSFDGAGPATHDLIRGHGTFVRAVAACEQFASWGIPFDLSVTISRPNVNELADVAALGYELGCRRVFFSEVSRAGRAAQNWDLLRLTPSQHSGLPAAVAEVARSVFRDGGLAADDSCWVTGESLYINSQGRAFLCAEIAQQNPRQAIADLTAPGGPRQAMEVAGRARHGHRRCLYESFASEHISLTLVHDRPCAVLALGGPAALGEIVGSTPTG